MPPLLTIRDAADLAAFACRTELAAGKPGNVTLQRGLPALTPAAFLKSAAALRAAFARRGRRTVGSLVLDTVRRTRRRVGTNTNLGLALILAPLALAGSAEGDSTAQRRGRSPRRSPGLRARVRRVLRSLTVHDAAEVYEAIRLADPGGMGSVEKEDVSGEPTRDLRACMGLAAQRDSIAAEYSRDYPVTFGVGAPALRAFLRQGASPGEAIMMTFLKLLAARPDSLISRKRGLATARRVSRMAAGCLTAGGTQSALGRRRIASLDRRLRERRLNPGTTADLTAAAIFAALASSPTRLRLSRLEFRRCAR